MNKKGNPENLIPGNKPKIFTAEEFISQWRAYNRKIIEDGFKDLPTVTGFCDYLEINFKGVARSTIYNTLSREMDTIKKEFEVIRADTLARGAGTANYNPTTSIFCLKNWCDWTDKQEQKIDMSAKVQRIEDYLAEYDD